MGKKQREANRALIEALATINRLPVNTPKPAKQSPLPSISMNPRADTLTLHFPGHAVQLPIDMIEAIRVDNALADVKFLLDGLELRRAQHKPMTPFEEVVEQKLLNMKEQLSGIKFKTLNVLVNTLKERNQARDDGRQARIGTKAEPVQAMVDEFLSKGGRVNDDVARGEEALRKMGIDPEELELDI